MKQILSILLALVIPSWALGQTAPDSLWSYTFGGSGREECYSMQQTADGGYILAGVTASFGAGEQDFYLVKTDDYGVSLWSCVFGGSERDECRSVQQTSDGGYILAAHTASFGAGRYDCWLLKTDSHGDSVWSRTFGGSDWEYCRCVQQTADGGYILAGSTYSFGVGRADFWLVKTNADGDSLWSHTFGGSSFDYCWSVRQTSDGGYILAGETESFGAGHSDFWLVKTDANGDSLWSRTFGGNSWDVCHSVRQTSDGRYILAGYTLSFGAGNYDGWVVTAQSNGDSMRSRTFGGSATDGCLSVELTSDGGYILAGHTESFGAGDWDVWLVKTDGYCDSLWSRTFGGSATDCAHAVQQISDGSYALAGYTISFGSGSYDFWLVKTGQERPYHLTVVRWTSTANPIVRWMAPQTCDYNIYSTTNPNPDEPPIGWLLEITLPNVPAGLAAWGDTTGLVPYKRYAVTMECP